MVLCFCHRSTFRPFISVQLSLSLHLSASLFPMFLHLSLAVSLSLSYFSLSQMNTTCHQVSPFLLAGKCPITTSLYRDNPPPPSGYRSDMSSSKRPAWPPYQLPQCHAWASTRPYIIVLLAPQLACELTNGKKVPPLGCVPRTAIWKALNK